jgi:hypothetical protein
MVKESWSNDKHYQQKQRFFDASILFFEIKKEVEQLDCFCASQIINNTINEKVLVTVYMKNNDIYFGYKTDVELLLKTKVLNIVCQRLGIR